MQINFKTLTLQNFKSHQDLVVNFGEVTKISGDNAKGKSSIQEAITWTVYGVDPLGGKLDPTPITYEAEETKASLLLNVDGKDLMLARSLKKGKVVYYVNDVPSKAKEFTEVTDKLFDKDLFLSLFNPNYFPSMHWEKQRAMLLQYVTAPANKEVLVKLPEEQSKTLSALLKKHSLSDIEKIHRESKTSLDKKYIAAQSRTKTLKEQLDQLPAVAPLESLKIELNQIDKQVKEKENSLDDLIKKNQDYNSLQSQIRAAQDRVDMSKERWPALKNEVIEDECKTCNRPLDAESVEAVKADKESRIAIYKANHKKLCQERDAMKDKLTEIEYIDISELREEIRQIDAAGQPLREALRTHSQFEKLKEQVDQAQADEKEILQSLNESIFIIDSVKDFKAKEAELQAEKVQALFDTLSIRLFEEQKNGEFKNTFEIELDGKPYRTLSLSESIRAGLELRDVLSKQSEVITPVFVDNAESITSFKEPVGQLIVSRVIAGQELKIERVKN